MRKPRATLAGRGPSLPAPCGLRASWLEAHGEHFLVLSYPLARLELPQGLTSAQRETVAAILAGKSRSQVARERGTSTRTVANLLSQAFRRLGVCSRMELAAQLSSQTRELDP